MLRLTNTLTGRKENFEPIHPPQVLMYVCGPTVYGDIHIGNARSAVNFDVIQKYLRFSGYQVKYAVNVTDIDDKIIKRANEEGKDFREIAKTYTEAYLDVMKRLGVDAPDIRPRAMDHMKAMQDLIGDLVAKSHAYPAGGDVYFDTPSFKTYGKLSHKNLEELQEGARVEKNDLKHNSTDFVLWKGAKPGEPQWDSPWGPGRPGWHIECSAMIRQHLGDSIDIHGGGVDLTFPHHENEIAQCEAATGKPYVKYWLHNGFLEMGGQKMSKSLGNILKAKDALEEYRPEVLRYFFLSAGYRNGLNYDREGLDASRRGWDEFHQTFARVEESLALGSAGNVEPSTLQNLVESAEAKFREAMDDDFNTPKALGVLFELSRECRHVVSQGAVSESAMIILKNAIQTLKKLGGLLGVVAVDEKVAVPAEVEALARKRVEAKNAKNWAEADRLRAEITIKGYILEDVKGGGFRLLPKQ
jgi:cysteinyl-tRNA synthetase